MPDEFVFLSFQPLPCTAATGVSVAAAAAGQWSTFSVAPAPAPATKALKPRNVSFVVYAGYACLTTTVPSPLQQNMCCNCASTIWWHQASLADVGSHRQILPVSASPLLYKTILKLKFSSSASISTTRMIVTAPFPQRSRARALAGLVDRVVPCAAHSLGFAVLLGLFCASSCCFKPFLFE